MNIITSILLLVLIAIMIVFQIIMFIDHKKSTKLTDEVSKAMLEDLNLSIKQKLEEIVEKEDKKTKKSSKKVL